MTASSELIILNTTKFRENQLVLHTLSREHGRRSFLVRVGRKAGMALFLPLNLVEGDVTENPKSSLWTIRNLSALHPLGGIRGNLYKNTMTLFMSEVLFRTLKEGAVEEGLFDWCRRSILTLDALEADFSNYPIRFLLELSAALGFSPTFDDIAPFVSSRPATFGGHTDIDGRRPAIVDGHTGFDGSRSTIVDGHTGIDGNRPAIVDGHTGFDGSHPAIPTPNASSTGSGPVAGRPAAGFNHLQALKAFLGASFSESMLIPLSGADRNALAEDLIRYLEFHSETPINIRSLKVLRDLYGS